MNDTETIGTQTSVDLLATYDTVHKRKNQIFFNVFDVASPLIIACMAYTGVVQFISQHLKGAGSVLASLTVYLLLLLALSALFQRKQTKIIKSGQDFLLSSEQTASAFSIFLLANAIYFFSFACLDASDDSASMGLTQLILYSGFNISLEQLFADSKAEKKCIFSGLVTPFSNLNIGKRDLWKIVAISSAIIIFVVLREYVWVLIPVILVLMISMAAVSKRRKTIINRYCEKLIPEMRGKQVLIWQIGNGLPLINAISKKMEMDDNCRGSMQNVEQPGSGQYDIIVVINTLSKREAAQFKISCSLPQIKENGIIVDPYLDSKRVRNTIRAWWGFPHSAYREMSKEEYATAVEVEKNSLKIIC